MRRQIGGYIRRFSDLEFIYDRNGAFKVEAPLLLSQVADSRRKLGAARGAGVPPLLRGHSADGNEVAHPSRGALLAGGNKLQGAVAGKRLAVQ